MISEIANQKVKISSNVKTVDKSEVSDLPMFCISYVNIFLAITIITERATGRHRQGDFLGIPPTLSVWTEIYPIFEVKCTGRS